MTTKTFITFIATLSMFGGAAPLSAKVEPVTATVEIGDLDLATDKGVTSLKRRFVGAIKLACGHADTRSRSSIRAVNQCRDDLNLKASLAVAEIARHPGRLAKAKQINVHG